MTRQAVKTEQYWNYSMTPMSVVVMAQSSCKNCLDSWQATAYALTDKETDIAQPSIDPITSKWVRAKFTSNASMRIQMSWLTVIPGLDVGNFAMGLVMRGWSDFSMATCQTLIMEVAMMTSIPLGLPWLLGHKQTLVQYPSEGGINHLTSCIMATHCGANSGWFLP